jgi:hypothetical protein
VVFTVAATGALMTNAKRYRRVPSLRNFHAERSRNVVHVMPTPQVAAARLQALSVSSTCCSPATIP